MKKICIVGAGGFGREVFYLLKNLNLNPYCFIDDFNQEKFIYGIPVLKFTDINSQDYSAVMAIGDPHLREKLINKLPEDMETPTFIHPSALIMGNVKLGKGSLICAHTVLTTDIELGDFSQININCTIGHDTKTGKFFTTAPGSSISGGTRTGHYVRFGPNTCTVEKVNIVDDVFIGAGAVVSKDITEPGVYVGIPAKWKRGLNK